MEGWVVVEPAVGIGGGAGLERAWSWTAVVVGEVT